MYQERASRFDRAVVWQRSVPDDTGAVRPVLPDGCMDLLWIGGRLLVAGPDTHAYHPRGIAGVHCVGLRFAPGAAPALLGVPAHELRDRRVELTDLWPAARVRRLTGRLASAADPVAELEAVALDRAAESPAQDPLARDVVDGLAAGRSVTDCAAAVGIGARQLHRRSLDAFGYGPKTLARVLRLQRALTLVGRGAPYATAAVTVGCADQAHLAREMRDLAGLTLSDWAAAPAA